MKRPVLTHFLSRISDRGLKALTIAILFMVMFVDVSLAQPVFTQRECYCLDNSTTPTNGQYVDTITITSLPGQTWRLMNPIGLYNPLSLNPPAVPILFLNNTIVPETATGSGVYRIIGKRISGQPWSVIATNGVVVQALSSMQSCSYPAPPATTISGDEFVCQNTTESYAIPANANLSGIVWSVNSGGIITSGQGTNAITVDWGANGGKYGVTVQATLASYPAQPQPCEFSTTLIVNIVDPAQVTAIQGDFGNCVGASEVYTLAASAASLSGVSWGVYLDSAGTIISGIVPSGTVNRQTIQWPSSPGVFYIVVSGNFQAGNNACPFTSVRRVDIVSEPLVSLACNNQVNLSMNPSCELYFSPDQFLEDQFYPNSSYDIVIRDQQRDTIIPNGTLGYKYINKTLKISVIHECSGNSCWGLAKIEDKAIPELVCPDDLTVDCEDVTDLAVTGFPVVPIDAVIVPIVGQPTRWLVRNFDRCSDVFIEYTDDAETDLCDSLISAIITRTWVVTDNYNNTSSCTQIISVNQADINDVIFPQNYDSATGPYASLEACDTTWIPIADGPYKGNPSPESTGYPFGTMCLKASVSFEDIRLPICGPNAFKVRRRWTVIEHCTGQIRMFNQLITVMDTQGPTLVCPSNLPGTTVIANISSTAFNCGGNWNVLPPVSLTDCSGATYAVDFQFPDQFGNFNLAGPFVRSSGTTSVNANNTVISNLPFGVTAIRYVATDACANTSSCVVYINVIDNQPPTPVCDKNTIIAIGSGGMAFAGVLTFDDGSHDNCGLDYMKVRRMDVPTDWSVLVHNNEVKFTCDDIGKVIMVELGVWDNAGLFNSCMVEARVQDNIFPTLTIPANVTANCDEDFTNLTRFGTATATDNCSATVRDSISDLRNECGLGDIRRVFIATDPFGNKTIKIQIITVRNNRPFAANNILWPANITLNNGCVANVDPDALPLNNRRPRYTGNTQCAQLAQNYEDIVFNYTEEACAKILRRWTVIDWCQTVPGFPEIGVFTYTQVIMVNNTTAPTITKGCLPADLTITQVGVCSANVNITATATDDCTDASLLKWTYTIDEGNNGTVEVSNGVGPTINRSFPYGTHKITWSVKDACNNVRTCNNIFTIADTKKPTPYCITDIVTVIMPSTGEIAIWASDFDLGATDNCSVGNELVSSFSPTNRFDISRRITCADLGGATSKLFKFDVYTIDAAGNFDYCTVNVTVQANGNACEDIDDQEQGRVLVSGNIYNEESIAVKDVNVELSSNQAEFPKANMTGTEGKYSFGELPMYQNYAVVPSKEDNPLNGVSTLDLVLIQRHILGIAELNSPYKIIAADVNNSQKVSSADLLDLRKVILGINSQFTNNKSWRFVDVAQQFNDPKAPFPYSEIVEMANLDHNVAGMDFIAVKIGDVNGSATFDAQDNGINPRSTVKLLTNKVSGKAGDVVDIKVSGENISNVLGFQMALRFDEQAMEIIEFGDKLNLKDENINFQMLSEGKVVLSWNNTTASELGHNVITIKARLIKDVKDSQVIFFDNSILPAEIYTLDGGSVVSQQLQIESRLQDGEEKTRLELYQNIPNPFNAFTTISFTLPTNDNVTLKIYDLTGKVVYQTKGYFTKGYNNITLDVQQLDANGVLYYQLDTKNESATRKMIVIK